MRVRNQLPAKLRQVSREGWGLYAQQEALRILPGAIDLARQGQIALLEAAGK